MQSSSTPDLISEAISVTSHEAQRCKPIMNELNDNRMGGRAHEERLAGITERGRRVPDRGCGTGYCGPNRAECRNGDTAIVPDALTHASSH